MLRLARTTRFSTASLAMSGISCSISLITPADQAPEIVKQLSVGDTSHAVDALLRQNYGLVSMSRNSWLEVNLNRLVKGFNLAGLDYFTDRFDESGGYVGDWTCCALNEAAIKLAVSSTKQLLNSFLSDINYTAALLGDIYISPLDVEVGLSTPKSMKTAIDDYDQHKRTNEGDDIASLLSFIHAHHEVLKQALFESKAVTYAVYLY